MWKRVPRAEKGVRDTPPQLLRVVQNPHTKQLQVEPVFSLREK